MAKENQMANDNGISRRDLLGTAGVAGLTALGVALLPLEARAGLKDYPAMHNAHDSLMDARKALEKGQDIFGGHRAKAIDLIDKAIEEIRAGVKLADGK
jgi:hypothetical protein